MQIHPVSGTLQCTHNFKSKPARFSLSKMPLIHLFIIRKQQPSPSHGGQQIRCIIVFYCVAFLHFLLLLSVYVCFALCSYCLILLLLQVFLAVLGLSFLLFNSYTFSPILSLVFTLLLSCV